MAQLQDKTVIVTGATSGIGLAAARRFAAEGASLVLCARHDDALDTLVDELRDQGARATALAGDVRDEAVTRGLVEAATTEFGGLDAAFNNAGGDGEMGPVEDMSLDQWRDTIDLNLTSAFLAAKYQMPALRARGGGSIVFTSSFVGPSVGFPGLAAYAAAKNGIVGLVRVLAVEHGGDRIRANALLPGGTDTPSNHANKPGAGPEVRQFIEGLHGLKRLGTPDEIANAALFLVSDASSFVTGTALLADGGVSITKT